MAIPLTCSSCAYEFKVKEELAGKRIKCPKCGEVLAVKATGSGQETAVTAKKPAPRAVQDEDQDEEERPRRKKKKKAKSNRGLIIGLAGGALGLILIVALVLILMGGGQEKKVVRVEQKPAPQPAANQQEEPPPPPKKHALTAIGRVRDRTETSNTLKQLGIAYRNFETITGKGPKNQKELAPYYENVRAINEALESKWITFIWGANRSSFPEGSSNTILAYETDADESGNRLVLKGDASVDLLNEAEFQKTPKATGK